MSVLSTERLSKSIMPETDMSKSEKDKYIKELSEARKILINTWVESLGSKKQKSWSDELTKIYNKLLSDIQESIQSMQNGVNLYDTLIPKNLLKRADDLLVVFTESQK